METKELLEKAKKYISVEKDDFFRNQIEELIAKEDYTELTDRFYTDLAFGTGGLRGVIGGGTNRMNPFTVQRATQGVASYIKKTGKVEDLSVAIAYDSRNFSDVFALQAAMVLCGNGIKTYLYTGLRSTPQLSFTVRHLNTTAGIVVTASHNPAEYNGYKVYWNDGGQIVPPHDKGIISEVLSVEDIQSMDEKTAIEKGLLVYIDEDVDKHFIDMVKSTALRPKLIQEKGKDLKVVYTPLHGAGAIPVSRALKEMGINVIFVEEQKEPNGDFPTVSFPNPEEAAALKLALDLSQKEGADLLMATDPDSDRLGIAVPGENGYELITGNQLGVLLEEYILSTKKELGILPSNSAIVKTIVTTELQSRIAESFGVKCFSTLTGFKYIAEKIRDFETGKGDYEYIFGGEESYGYLTSTNVRDKDAVSAATMTAELTLYHRSNGVTLLEHLNSIYEKYGYFEESLVSKYFKGQSGLEIMNNLMEKLRKNPPSQWGNETLVEVKDYLDGTTYNISSNQKNKDIDLPSSNVLQFLLSKNSIVTVRPSGTEPKIKFYTSCCGDAGEELEVAKENVAVNIKAISKTINDLINM